MNRSPIPAQHAATLKTLHDTLAGRDIIWALTGSTSFALQGMSLVPDDIDIQTDEAGAYAIEALFSGDILVPVRFSSTERICSHFGKLRIKGVDVELMGAIQKRHIDGSWEDPVDVNGLRIEIAYAGMNFPVLPLTYEAQAYIQLGRPDRAAMIQSFLDGRA